jgi:hypothetical protein
MVGAAASKAWKESGQGLLAHKYVTYLDIALFADVQAAVLRVPSNCASVQMN